MIFTSVCPTVYTVCRVVEEEWHPSEKTATDDSILEWDEISLLLCAYGIIRVDGPVAKFKEENKIPQFCSLLVLSTVY